MYMHLFWLQEILREDGALRYKRYGLLHVVPPVLSKFVPKSGFSKVPVWFGLCYLSLAQRSQTKDALSFIHSLLDADPTALLHSVQGPSQCCAVHYEALAQAFLIHLTRCGQGHEQSELCDFETGLL